MAMPAQVFSRKLLSSCDYIKNDVSQPNNGLKIISSVSASDLRKQLHASSAASTKVGNPINFEIKW
jgi:hypothetical protein